MLDEVLKGFSSGTRDRVVSSFRYFEESRRAEEVAAEKQIVRLFFSLVTERFGRPGGFEPAKSTLPQTVNIYMESASTDLWNRSRCLFKSYPFKTVFSDGKTRRPADVIFDLCLETDPRRAWVRKIDIRFSAPDSITQQATLQTVQGIMQKVIEEARRLDTGR